MTPTANHWDETLAELERIRADCQEAIRLLTKLKPLMYLFACHEHAALQPPALPALPPASRVYDASISVRVLDVLRRNPNRPYAIQEMALILGDGTPTKSVTGALTRLHNAGAIARVGRGLYVLHAAPTTVAAEGTVA